MELPFNHTVVNGIVYPSCATQKNMDELKSFRLCSDNIVINTYPKSGTTWMQYILKLITNNGIDDGINIDKSIVWLETLSLAEATASNQSTPKVFKCHASYSMMPGGPPNNSPAKYIYIARNPKDVAASYYHHMRLFKAFGFTASWDDFFQLFMDGKVYYGSWFDHVLEWWKHRKEANILFLKYEDMKKDFSGAVERVSKFIGYDQLSPVVLNAIVEQATFENMRKNTSVSYSWESCNADEAPFIRRGTVGDWRGHFTEEQSTEFDAVYAQKMKDSSLDFDF